MLETIPGVGQVTDDGLPRSRTIRIWVDADEARSRRTSSVTDVITARSTKQHVTSPGGRARNGRLAFDVRVVGEAADLETLRRHRGQERRGTSDPRLSDVALVEDGFVDITQIARIERRDRAGDGHPEAARLERGRRRQRGAQGRRDELQKTLPPGMKLEVIFDTTEFINESVNEIGLELGLAVVLTGLVCWVFLGSLSSTMNVLFAIPMSLLGRSRCSTSAASRSTRSPCSACRSRSASSSTTRSWSWRTSFATPRWARTRMVAAAEGTKEITFAALAATIAVIAIFMPVAFMSGIIGKFFLAVRRHAVGRGGDLVHRGHHARARALRADAQTTSHAHAGFVGRAGRRGFDALSRGYARGLDAVAALPVARARHRASAVLAAPACGRVAAPQEFVPSQDQSRLQRAADDCGRREPRRDRRARPARGDVPDEARPRSSTCMSSVEHRQHDDLSGHDGRPEAAQAHAERSSRR